jgi:hypothetical protein
MSESDTPMSNEPTIEQKIGEILASVNHENPLDYLDSIYKSINPALIRDAVSTAKRVVTSENKKNGKPVNVYMSIGGEELNRSFYTGILSALLWLPSYLLQCAERGDIESKAVETTLNTLSACHLPKMFNAYTDKNGKQVVPTSVQQYTSFLLSVITWGTSACHVQTGGPVRTNLEAARLITGTALGSFPSIASMHYYIDTIKTTDIMQLSEKLGQSMNWIKYMTPLSMQINQPRFIVQTSNAPLVGIAGHPCSNMLIAEADDNNMIHWVGLFSESKEFGDICAARNLSQKDVKRYIIMTSPEAHRTNLAIGLEIAKFIEEQQILKQIYTQRNS